MIPSDMASILGLVLAELITNNFKHAYAGDKAGTIAVTFSMRGESEWSLEVADSGKGLPVDFDVSSSKGVGMRVVNALVRRLGATLHIRSQLGRTAFKVVSAD